MWIDHKFWRNLLKSVASVYKRKFPVIQSANDDIECSIAAFEVVEVENFFRAAEIESKHK